MSRQPVPPSSLWHHRDFLKLWAGQTVSLFGSQVTDLALPLTAILLLHASPVQMAVLTAAIFLPSLLVNLPSGVWIDRLPRRPVLIATDVGQTILLATIPATALLDILTMGQLYVVSFLASSLAVVAGNAHGAYLPSLIEAEQLPEGNSKLEVSRYLAQIAGPGAGGLLVQILTAPFAILADAVSFVISATSFVTIRTPEPAVAQADTKSSMWQEARDGIAFVRNHVVIWAPMAAVGAANLLLAAAASINLLFMTHQLHLSPGLIGILFSVAGPSGLVGVFLAPRIGRAVGLGPAIILGGMLYGLGNLALPLAGGSMSEIVAIVGAGQVLMGLSSPNYFINWLSIRQAMTPTALQGRVSATTGMVALGMAPIGALLGGISGQTIGLRPTLAVAGLGVVLAFGLLSLTGLRRLRTIPSPSS